MLLHAPLTRYTKLLFVYAPGKPGMFSPSLLGSDPDMHHGTCVTHVPWCMPGSLNNGFLWSRWRGKRSRHFRRVCNPQFFVSGKSAIHLIYLSMPLCALMISGMCLQRLWMHRLKGKWTHVEAQETPTTVIVTQICSSQCVTSQWYYTA